MIIYYKDKKHSFVELFNTNNGFSVRSNVIIDGVESENVANRRSFPELIDIGIMSHCHAAESNLCKNAGVDCYQNATAEYKPNMCLDEYKKILNQCKGKVFQVALGGAGDPNKHEDFHDILKYTRELQIVPNLATSGYNMSVSEVSSIREYCGAVAVSFYSKLNQFHHESNQQTISAINTLVDAGCKVNVHYVLSQDTLDEAIERLNNNLFPKGINAVIFLLYKPVGAGKMEKVLSGNDKKYIDFLKTIHHRQLDFRIGFDTCQSPALLINNKSLSIESIDACEATRFSMYIDSNSIAYPCSFGSNQDEYSVSLKKESLEYAWNSNQFGKFRKVQDTMCNSCIIDGCVGCALDIGLNSCGYLV